MSLAGLGASSDRRSSMACVISMESPMTDIEHERLVLMCLDLPLPSHTGGLRPMSLSYWVAYDVSCDLPRSS
jgi:hypothetical protein